MRKLWVCCLLLWPLMLVQADEMVDPTRPFLDGVAPAADAQGVRQEPVSDTGLKTIVISPDRRSVVIDGKQVALGAMVGQERLVGVCEDSVMLLRGERRRRVALYPDVDISGRQRDMRCNEIEVNQLQPVAAPVEKTKARAKQQAKKHANPRREKLCK